MSPLRVLSLSEVIGVDEVGLVLVQLFEGFVEAFDVGFFEGSVHAFHLAIGPWVLGLVSGAQFLISAFACFGTSRQQAVLEKSNASFCRDMAFLT